MQFVSKTKYGVDFLQKMSLSLMAVLVMLTFVGANMQALLWQSSTWLVSTVLPAVVVDLTNDERADIAAAPLKRNATLDAAATLKAQHMARNEYFSHFSPDGVSPWHWFDQAGYVYAHAGENLAIHFTDSTQVVDAWMNSPTHRENIVNGKYTEIGVGTAKGTYEGYDTVYVVQLFGTPAVAPARLAQASPDPTPSPAVEVPTPTPVETLALAPTEVGGAEVDVATFAPEPLSSEPSLETRENNLDIPASAAAPVDVAIPVEVEEPAFAPESPVVYPTEPVETTPPTQPVDTQIALNQPQNTAPPASTETVVVESPIIATSSGLAVAQVTREYEGHAGATVASIATQPNTLLQVVYMTIGFMVLIMLSISIALEARRFHYTQVAYSFGLLLVMGGLWFVHTVLTTGAVIA